MISRVRVSGRLAGHIISWHLLPPFYKLSRILLVGSSSCQFLAPHRFLLLWDSSCKRLLSCLARAEGFGWWFPNSYTEMPYLLRCQWLTTSHFGTAKSLQSCPTLCDPIDGSPPGSPVPGILQARTLEWAAISFSNAWKWKVKVKSFSRVWVFETPRTAAYQAPPSMGFSRQKYWSGLPLPSPTLALMKYKSQDKSLNPFGAQLTICLGTKDCLCRHLRSRLYTLVFSLWRCTLNSSPYAISNRRNMKKKNV